MTLDQKREIALARYAVIAPLVTGAAEPSMSNNEFFRQAAAKEYTGPDGKPMAASVSTIEKWFLAYRKNGFDALLPASRSDEGISRRLD